MYDSEIPLFRTPNPDGAVDIHGAIDVGTITAEQALSDMICQKLMQDYPGHPWHVEVMAVQGLAKVRLGDFSLWSFNIHLSTLRSDPSLLCVTRAGGELLERYRIPRSGFTYADFVSARAKYTSPFKRNQAPPE